MLYTVVVVQIVCPVETLDIEGGAARDAASEDEDDDDVAAVNNIVFRRRPRACACVHG